MMMILPVVRKELLHEIGLLASAFTATRTMRHDIIIVGVGGWDAASCNVSI